LHSLLSPLRLLSLTRPAPPPTQDAGVVAAARALLPVWLEKEETVKREAAEEGGRLARFEAAKRAHAASSAARELEAVRLGMGGAGEREHVLEHTYMKHLFFPHTHTLTNHALQHTWALPFVCRGRRAFGAAARAAQDAAPHQRARYRADTQQHTPLVASRFRTRSPHHVPSLSHPIPSTQ
jgi:hypothetical protein